MARILNTYFGMSESEDKQDSKLSSSIRSGKLTFGNEDYTIWLCLNAETQSISQQRHHAPKDDSCTFVLTLYHNATSKLWSGHFTPTYIKQLTQKTGNLKEYLTFLSMLKSAICQNSQSVTLDLLSSEELKTLREKNHISPNLIQVTSCTDRRNSNSYTDKCYLLLCYSAEFERVRYPLPLTQAGELTSAQLLEAVMYQIRLLQSAKSHTSAPEAGYKSTAAHLDSAKEQINLLLEEKQQLESELRTLKLHCNNEDPPTNSKDAKVLRKIVRNLEQNLLQEKSKYQKFSQRKNDDYNTIAHELERLKSSERTLNIRVKSLTNELETFKRGRRLSSLGVARKRSLSADRPKLQTPPQRGCSSSEDGNSLSRVARKRSLSADRASSITTSRYLNNNNNNGYIKSRESSHYSRRPSRTPSPRFDPTAYVKNQHRKISEAQRLSAINKSAKTQRSRSNSKDRSHYLQVPPRKGHSRHSSASSVGSLDTSQQYNDYAHRRGRSRERNLNIGRENSRQSLKEYNNRVPSSSSRSSRNSLSRERTKKRSREYPISQTNKQLDESLNLTDIDQRIDALKILVDEYKPYLN